MKTLSTIAVALSLALGSAVAMAPLANAATTTTAAKPAVAATTKKPEMKKHAAKKPMHKKHKVVAKAPVKAAKKV